MRILKNFNRTNELARSQVQLQVISEHILDLLDILSTTGARLDELETKPRFAGSIWMKKGRYPYAVHPTKNGKRKREYIGLDGLEALQESVSNHNEYEALKKRFSKLHSRYNSARFGLENTKHILSAGERNF